MLGMTLFQTSNMAQRILSQSSNITYAVRGAYRAKSVVPDDRQADYLFRDFHMGIATAYYLELGFRLMHHLYEFPLMARALNLHRLKQLYGPEHQNYGTIEAVDALRKRISGSLVREETMYMIPANIDNYEIEPRLEKLKDSSLSKEARAALEAEVKELGQLNAHLRKVFAFKSHLKKTGNLAPGEVLQVMDALKEIRTPQKLVSEHWYPLFKTLGKQGTLAGYLQEQMTLKNEKKRLSAETAKVLESYLEKGVRLRSLVNEALEKAHSVPNPDYARVIEQLAPARSLTEGDARDLAEVLKQIGEEWKGKKLPKAGLVREKLEQWLLDGIEADIVPKYGDKLKNAIRDGLGSQRMVRELQRVLKTSFWLKLITTATFSFVLYGVIASFIDVRIIQPWEKKITKQGYKTGVVGPASFWSLIPGTAAAVALMSDGLGQKVGLGFMKKLGYTWRFAAAGLAALGVYGASTLALTKYYLAKATPHPPDESEPLQGPQLMHPSAFRAFEA